MDDLTYLLPQLCLRNYDDSHATQADRQRLLSLAARQLREAGYLQMRATSLESKHVQALRSAVKPKDWGKEPCLSRC
jgi:hypothetical protein